MRRWRAFEQIAEKHRSDLPEHLQSRFSAANFGKVWDVLQNMGIAVAFEEEDLTREKTVQRERTAIAQTYILWLLKMAPYRGKWNDMHLLALAWHMSPAGSPLSFRTVVARICKGATSAHRLEKSWESVLSEKV